MGDYGQELRFGVFIPPAAAQAGEQVGEGSTDPAAMRLLFNRMTIRQNNWTLGAFCESYCRAVTAHHSLEDRSVFPHLGRRDEQLGAVLERLGGTR